MVITVIGSVTKSKNEMLNIKDYFESRGGNIVHTPCDAGIQDLPLLSICLQWIYNISVSDLVIAVPKYLELKNDQNTDNILTFGESTTYEIAIARYLCKPVLYWTDLWIDV